MRVLITGANGQLGSALLKQANQIQVKGCSRDTLDVTNCDQVDRVINAFKPDVVIHCAAYTKVDEAEVHADTAYLINAVGTRNVAVAAEEVGAVLVYVSTDYVFNGKKQTPIDEWEPPSPLGVYGRSKLAGEEAVRSLHSRFFIVRTSWVFGHDGSNFVKTMLRLGESTTELSVVTDQIGSPTYANDLAVMLLKIIQTKRYGTYHVSNKGSCSWYEFAEAIFSKARINVQLKPCKTDAFPRLAKRPAYSVFSHQALKLNGFPEMRTWEAALIDFLREDKRT